MGGGGGEIMEDMISDYIDYEFFAMAIKFWIGSDCYYEDVKNATNVRKLLTKISET